MVDDVYSKSVEHWAMLNDLPIDRMYTVVLREVLRGLGLSGFEFHSFDTDGPSKLRIDETSLAILRASLTVTVNVDQDSAFLALQHLDAAEARQSDAFGQSIPSDQALHRIIEVLRRLLASLCADAYSSTTDSNEYLQSAIDKFQRMLSPPKSRHMRYQDDNLIIEAPPVDRTYLTPLWADSNALSDVTQYLSSDNIPPPEEIAIVKDLQQANKHWSFWREWYQGLLDGKPIDWELQRRVALIEDTIWEAGPEAVATEIERIRAHYALEQEIERLKETLNQAAIIQASTHRLHNHPPEALEDETRFIGREIILVQGEIKALEAEIAKPAPSPTRLEKIATALWDISLKIGKYCASKIDIAITESAKVIGKTGTQIGLAALATTTATQNESIQSVAKAIWDFIKTLPPG